MTGVAIDGGPEVWDKRFQLLREVAPKVTTAAFPISPEWWDSPYARRVRTAAEKAGVSLVIAPVNSPSGDAEYRDAFAGLRERSADAIMVIDSPGALARRRLIVELIRELRLPAVYPYRGYVEVGGLIAYSADIPGLMRHAAGQIDQVLKGAKPEEIPFYQATKFLLDINLQTAKALGLTIPPALLARADEVID